MTMLLIAAAIAAGVARPAMAAKGTCQTTKTTYRTQTETAETNSDDWSVLPKSKVVFVQGGNKASCVVVRFSAIPRAGYLIGIRAVIDGTIIAEPGNIDLDYMSAAYLSPRGFEFVFKNIDPGKHALRIEWANWADDMAVAYVFKRTITVQHR